MTNERNGSVDKKFGDVSVEGLAEDRIVSYLQFFFQKKNKGDGGMDEVSCTPTCNSMKNRTAI